MTADLVTLAVAGIPDAIIASVLTGGFVGAIATLVTARSNAKRTDAEAEALVGKLPAEIDSIAVQGAEAAVLTMKAALDSANRHIEKLEHDREADRQRIARLEKRVEELQGKVDAARRALRTAHQDSESIREELASLRGEHIARDVAEAERLAAGGIEAEHDADPNDAEKR